MIIRKISKEQEAVVRPFLVELHSLTFKTPGYISGESLINSYIPDEHLVISSWHSLEDWMRFCEIKEVKDLHYKVDQILGKETNHTIYHNR